MNKPFLFIDTPRAGRHNHRFIIPKNCSDGDELLSQFADTARQPAEAADTIISTTGIYFLATGKKASQTSGGRIGWEQLILVNVEVKKLSKEQIANIDSFLQQRLKEVERLVIETIDWNKINTIMVPRGELNQWLQQLEQQVGSLPEIKQPTKPAIKQPTKRKWYKDPINFGIAAIIGLGCIVIANYYIYLHKKQLDESVLKAARKQVERLITSIGGNETDVKNELKPFKLPDENAKIVADTWKINLGDNIKDSGTWPVSMFFKNVDGNAITTELWGKNIDQLQIADTVGSLQSLVKCRHAIRNLMEVTDADKVYTPFFQKEDFNENVVNLKNLVTLWGNKKSDALKTRNVDCIEQKNRNLVDWVNECFSFSGHEKDKKLPKIKEVGKTCKKVQFISPTVPDKIN